MKALTKIFGDWESYETLPQNLTALKACSSGAIIVYYYEPYSLRKV